MAIELRLPNITGLTEKEQLSQIRSYLYQLIPQLQWELDNLTKAERNPSSAITPMVIARNGSNITTSIEIEDDNEVWRIRMRNRTNIYDLKVSDSGISYIKNDTVIWSK